MVIRSRKARVRVENKVDALNFRDDDLRIIDKQKKIIEKLEEERESLSQEQNPKNITKIVTLSKSAERLGNMVQYLGEDPKTIDANVLLDMLRNPTSQDRKILAARENIRSPLTAIRAFCIECVGGSKKDVRMCTSTWCSLWPFRFGRNSLLGRVKDADVESTDTDTEEDATEVI